uniref:Uncharacterized protein n=1 Tax=Siphoviridae sp. ctxrg1 TaxID=2825741 RepID=A0A8S5Q4B4_9CAUD|nr:MAG TPA: hypothetical protein [Siphoviridae sp. ctxrg1]
MNNLCPTLLLSIISTTFYNFYFNIFIVKTQVFLKKY